MTTYDTDNIVFARGYSLNYFSSNGDFDLFIIINEPNSTEKMDEAINFIDSYGIENGDLKELEDILETKYFPYGVQMFVKRSETGDVYE